MVDRFLYLIEFAGFIGPPKPRPVDLSTVALVTTIAFGRRRQCSLVFILGILPLCANSWSVPNVWPTRPSTFGPPRPSDFALLPLPLPIIALGTFLHSSPYLLV